MYNQISQDSLIESSTLIRLADDRFELRTQGYADAVHVAEIDIFEAFAQALYLTESLKEVQAMFLGADLIDASTDGMSIAYTWTLDGRTFVQRVAVR